VTNLHDGRVLYVIVCGAGPASEVGRLVDQAQERGWQVHVIATPAALAFVDSSALEVQTGNPVRSQYRMPGDAKQRSLPNADAIVVAPATYNTINKWALGVSDTYALGVLAESIGLGIPVVVLPFVNTALASRGPFLRAVEALRAEGVRVILGPGELEPHPPGTGGTRIPSFPWSSALDEADGLSRHSLG
jgi:phosphopantothenoylcysteine synthetase/decarboxylase